MTLEHSVLNYCYLFTLSGTDMQGLRLQVDLPLCILKCGSGRTFLYESKRVVTEPGSYLTVILFFYVYNGTKTDSCKLFMHQMQNK